jgi:uncharacterized protein YidB (DUF937 family)
MELLDSFVAKIDDSRYVVTDPLAVLIKSTIDLITHDYQGMAGGVPGLLDAADRAGVGDIVRSWMRRGPNREITPEQVTDLFGGVDNLARLAGAAGTTPADTARDLADVLPTVISELTPDGEFCPTGECQAGLGSAVYRQIMVRRAVR